MKKIRINLGTILRNLIVIEMLLIGIWIFSANMFMQGVTDLFKEQTFQIENLKKEVEALKIEREV